MGEENGVLDFITQKLVYLRNKALEISRNKKEPTKVYVSDVMSDEQAEKFKKQTYTEELQNAMSLGYNPHGMYLISEEDGGQGITKKHDPTYFANVPNEYTREHIVQQLERRKTGEMANCIKSLSECYPHGLPTGNSTFMADPLKYGFQEISFDEKQPGDLIQHINNGKPSHAMIFNGYDENDKPRFNYSNGFDEYKVNGKYYSFLPFINYKAYRYVGTPQDSINWINEYNNLKE